MAPRTATALEEIFRTAGGAVASTTDRELLRRFADAGDQAAFATLFRRHSGMVFGACRRALSNSHDAEDACQATFLVLARKARSGHWQPSLANWLYSTARRVARNARVVAERRTRREGRAAVPEAVEPVDQMSARELLAALDEELDRLPPRYREPLVLCYLQGLSRDEAATRLGVPPATLKCHLERGRKRLGDALARRGCAAGAGLLALAATSASGAAPLHLTGAVLTAATGTPPAAVARLAAGVAGNGLPRKTLILALLLLGIGVVGVRAVVSQPPAAPPAPAKPAPARGAEPAAAPPAEKPKEVLKVTGRVIDPDGKPVAGARLVIPEITPSGEDKPVELTRSAEDGSFRCAVPLAEDPPGIFGTSRILHAYAPGFAADWVSLYQVSAEKPVTLQLARDDVPLRGRVVDLEGKAVPGAVVTVKSIRPTAAYTGEAIYQALVGELYVAPPPGSDLIRLNTRFAACAGVPAKVVADKDGRFEINGIGRTRMVCLSFRANGIETAVARVLTLPDYDTKQLASLVPSPYNPKAHPLLYGPEFSHVARPDAVIKGVVTDAKTGKPVAGANVTGKTVDGWWENQTATTTGADGSYRLTGVAKAANRQVTVEVAGDLPCLSTSQVVPDAAGLADTTADVRLPRGVLVKGRITNKVTGKPIPGARVTYAPLAANGFFATPQGANVLKKGASADTDKDGSFHLVATPGAGVITAGSGGEAAGQVCSYTRARLRPADRRWASGGPGYGEGEFAMATGGWLPLDANSAYQIIEPAEGAAPLELELQLDPGKAVSGKVVDRDGKPAAGVMAFGLDSAYFRPLTKLKDGAFTAVALDPERPRLAAFVDIDRKQSAAILLTGNEKEPLVIELRAWAEATGRVVDPDGKPCPGLHVYRTATEGPYAFLGVVTPSFGDKTDAAGRFRLDIPFADLTMAIRFFRDGGPVVETSGPVPELKLHPGETRDLGDITVKEK
jgi:RNA polymerase sigma factor (sigma-70 family)